ncbi:hypothetical protein BDA96_08G024100 [Sorghum bicolor]|uniref:BTB domain-containing protein n=2 Tax=Sorghum bicolor TaxID=4558 RepID=A0A921QD52_SORBI|nr:hypothetical protein BDA96_08G024100 [Sorghum bicolor]KXG22881.2 hypothetical protein SORBI_3008G021500 [Sorghum bicolor]
MNFVVVPPSILYQDFGEMLSDVNGRPVVPAELFDPMKEKAENLIRIDDTESAIFEALLHFIYTDRLPDSCSDGRNLAIMHLLVAADRYGVERLRLLCESKLSKAIDVEIVATTLSLAEQHNCSQLRRACIGFMASLNMFGPNMETDGFDHLIASCLLVMKEILDNVSCIWSGKQCR